MLSKFPVWAYRFGTVLWFWFQSSSDWLFDFAAWNWLLIRRHVSTMCLFFCIKLIVFCLLYFVLQMPYVFHSVITSFDKVQQGCLSTSSIIGTMIEWLMYIFFEYRYVSFMNALWSMLIVYRVMILQISANLATIFEWSNDQCAAIFEHCMAVGSVHQNHVALSWK